MINMEDKSMIFTLNGELLITNKGSELCFADFETEDGKQTIIFIKTNPVTYIKLLKKLQNKSCKIKVIDHGINLSDWSSVFSPTLKMLIQTDLCHL